MSMLTPRGVGGKSRRRRRRGRKALATLLVLAVIAAAAFAGWWYYLRDDDDTATPATTARPCPTVTSAPPTTPTSATSSSTPTAFLPGTPVAAAKVQVNVFNATKRAGLASNIGDQIASRGFQVTGVGNDPQKAKVPGTAVVRYGTAGAGAALTVAAQVQGAVPVIDKRKGAGLDLVLGDAFTTLRTVAQASAAATPVASPTPTPTPTPTGTCVAG